MFVPEIMPFTFSSTSFLVLEFKESFLRKRKVDELNENKADARRRRAASSIKTQSVSLSFRTRKYGLLVVVKSTSSAKTTVEV